MAQAPRNVVYEGLFLHRKELSNGFRIEFAISPSARMYTTIRLNELADHVRLGERTRDDGLDSGAGIENSLPKRETSS